MAELTEAGCVGFGQADVPLANTQVLQRALQYASTFGYTVWLRPQERDLGKGVAASGPLATRLGLAGVPVAAETIALFTIFELMRSTGARVHLCRLSQRGRRGAGARGQGRGPAADLRRQHQLAAPDRHRHRLLRQPRAPQSAAAPAARPRRAVAPALADGTIDALVSDHTPVEADAKTLPFAESGARRDRARAAAAAGAASGASRAAPGWRARIEVVTRRRRRGSLGALQASAGSWSKAASADLCVFDPAHEWQVAARRAAGARASTRPSAATRCAAACAARWSAAASSTRPERRRADAVARPPAGGCCAPSRTCSAGWWTIRSAFPRLSPAERDAARAGTGRERMLGPDGHQADGAGHAARARAGAAGGQPPVLARHPGDACGAACALRLQVGRAALAADRHAGHRRRHALHRARTPARRDARGAPHGRGAARRRHRSPSFPKARPATATGCCPSTPTCCRRRSPPARRCSRWRCASPTRPRGETSYAPRYIDDDNLLGSVWNTLKAPPLLAIVRFGEPQPLGRARSPRLGEVACTPTSRRCAAN